ncbi:MAG: glycosyltransferase family 39 protein, partial [Burkholderiales bacterium]|nr:glycosyltransferase family 39 protein [Burkholderiales bacterium]
TPRLNGVPYIEKPPLQYWATAAVFAAAGEDEWTARLAPAVAGFLAIVAVLLTVRRLFSRRAGWMAAAMLASSAGYFGASQFVTLDMTLTAFMTGALCAFLVAQDHRTGASARRRYMLAAWGMCALAVLTKGAVGLALPALAIAAYVAVTRDLALLRRLHAVPGAALFAGIAVPWFVLVELRNPGFAQFFFVHEHLQRFTQPVHRRIGPWWYFVPIATAFLLPWLPAIVAALPGRASRPPAGGFDARKFAWSWAAAIFVFFSLSSSKLPAYILPAMGAVAVAACVPVARRFDATLRIVACTLVLGGIATVIAFAPATGLIRIAEVREEVRRGAVWIYAAALVLGVGGIVTLLLLRWRHRLRALAAVVLAGMLAAQVAAGLALDIDQYFSAEGMIERIGGGEVRRPFHPDVPFYSVDTFDHTVPFYLDRTVTLVRDQDELAWGLGANPSLFVPTIDEFEARWRAAGQAYAIMRHETHEELARAGLPMRVVDRDVRRVVVARR